MKIAFDIDGVLLDFYSHWKSFASQVLAKELKQVSHLYSLDKHFGLTEKEVKSVWNRFSQTNQWADIKPYEDALEVMPSFLTGEHEIVCITAVSPNIEAQRRESLKVLGLDKHDIFFTGSHRGKENDPTKHDALMEVQPDLFIDDQILNLMHANECGLERIIWLDRDVAQMDIHKKNVDLVLERRIESMHDLRSYLLENNTYSSPAPA